MNPERWQQIKNLFHSVMEVEPELRSEYVTKLCNGDPELQKEVESLLAAEQDSTRLFERPALVATGALKKVMEYADPMIGRTLGSYRVERLLGHGGMGTVYFARSDQRDDPRVAIKTISRGLDTKSVVRRFQKEQQILANLDHANIARLFDGGTTDEGLPYFVMEYVEGKPIDIYCEERRLSTTGRLELFVQVCAAVDSAHQKGVVHRDIKPSNILVTSDGRPKLLDFGIAKIVNPDIFEDDIGATQTGATRVMTPDYASPEQVRGEPVTPATDVYALGILLYELLTGHRPYRLQTHSVEEMSRVVCNQEPAKPSTHTPLDSALDNITLKALRKEPGQRYATAAALAGDIQAFLEKRPISALRGALRYRARRYFTRNKRAIAFALSVIAVTAGSAIVLRWSAGRAANQLASQQRSDASVTAIKPRPSIAVLGFKNLSTRDDEVWLSTALSEMFTTELAAGGQLRTIRVENVSQLKLGLSVKEGQSPPNEMFSRVQKNLGADFLVDGSYLILGKNDQIRVDLRVSNTQQEVVLAVSETGPESDLFTIVSKAGSRLRSQLGLAESKPTDVTIARAAFPQDPAAIRLYTEGIDKLRVFDAISALPLLQKAAELDPQRPLVYSAIAEAWDRLGYDSKAADAAKKAFELTENLSRGERLSEERLSIEARYRETQQDFEKAIEVYRTLWKYFPDDLEYGLRLSSAQVALGKAKDALATVEALRQIPGPSSLDPRIDMAEGDAVGAIADYKRQQQAYAQAGRKARASGARLLLARARLGEGRSLYYLGPPKSSEEALEEARSLYTEAGDRAGIASALNFLGALYLDQTDLARSTETYQESFKISREIGDKRQVAAALNNLGIILKNQGRFEEALKMHREALAVRREIGNIPGAATVLSGIGVALFELDRFSEAVPVYEESLKIFRDLGDRRGIVRTLHNRSIVKKELGELAEARKGYEESLAIREEIGDRRGRVIGLVELAATLLQQGEIALSRRNIDVALIQSREMKFRPAEAQSLYVLGEIALVEGDLSTARKQHEFALTIRKEILEERTVLESRLALANLALEEGRPAEAVTLLQEVKRSLPAGTPAFKEATIALLEARAMLSQNNVAGAAQAVARAKTLSAATSRIFFRTLLTTTASRLQIAQKQSDVALKNLQSLLAELTRNGEVQLAFETRLVQCEAIGKSCAVALQADSANRGFKRVAQKAAALIR